MSGSYPRKAGWQDAPLELRDLPEAMHTYYPAAPILEFNQVQKTDEISAGPK